LAIGLGELTKSFWGTTVGWGEATNYMEDMHWRSFNVRG
jgi:hypothetical protein